MLTAIFDAKEERDVIITDIPNEFIQTKIPVIEYDKERLIKNIIGVLVDLLVEMAPEAYRPYVLFENVRKLLYV